MIMNFKIIEDNELLKEEFKKVVPKMDWFSKHRNIGKFREPFFIGSLDLEDRKIIVKIRPSLMMQVTESLKNLTADGKVPNKNYNGKLVNWGTSIEVKISKSFLEELLKEAKPKKLTNISKIIEKW